MNAIRQDGFRRRRGTATVRVLFSSVAVGVGALLLTASCREASAPPRATAEAAGTIGSPAGSGISRTSESKTKVFSVVPLAEAHLTLWWGDLPAEQADLTAGSVSTIRREDYVGPETCKECHAENYRHWSRHPHRWMNALAKEETVRGDFSGSADIHYLGGRGTFYRQEGDWRMRLERGGMVRLFDITRTIGSRFFQYYIGRMIEGPESAAHPARTTDHVLPFGYWFRPKEWVPVVHIRKERQDGLRTDPFAEAPTTIYDIRCSGCHTTKPIGDWMLQMIGMERTEEFTPRSVAFRAGSYLQEAHRNTPHPEMHLHPEHTQDLLKIFLAVEGLPSTEYAATLGVSCEACHNGAREHAEKSTKDETEQLPFFFPSSPYLHVAGNDPEQMWGRTPENLNWTCARCHTGHRPYFAAGMSTWNSTEYSDASKGHCYRPGTRPEHPSKMLTCVNCHSPHKAIGQKWSRTPQADDASCARCHRQYNEPAAVASHTHHPTGSEGSHCMNCHMPKVNEGMEAVVRTHTIFSPTDRRMLEANQPNACNLCHLDKPIDWTLKHLGEWYGPEKAEVSRVQMARNYPDRNDPVGIGWLYRPHESTRLVAAAALCDADARWALPQLIDMLDDPFLLNRQFTQQGLEDMLGVNLRDFGYRFYMTAAERKEPIGRIRTSLIE